MKLKSIIYIASIFCVSSTFAASSEVYTWKDKNGVVNFSQVKPQDSNSYEEVDIGEPVVIGDEKQQPQGNNKPVEINQSKMQRYEQQSPDSYQGAQQQQNVSSTNYGSSQLSTAEVAITSPQNGQSIFSKESFVEVTTSPQLSQSDRPQFIVNGSPVSGKYVSGAWQIARPDPGKIDLSISGTTARGEKIVASNTVEFFIRNGWAQQTINNQANNRGIIGK